MAFAAQSLVNAPAIVTGNQLFAANLVGAIQTLAGALDLSTAANADSFPSVLALDCGGAGRAVTLPTAADTHSLVIFMVNMSDAAESLTVNTNLAVINQNEATLFMNIAGTWTKICGFTVVVDQSA
jgi:hypothetical protein